VTAPLPPDGGDEAPTPAAFSRWLRQERELRGLSRDDVVRATKLAPGVIDGLESGDAARMPPRGYVYAYLRSYAAALGLDADDVVLRWQEVEVATGEPEAPRARGLPRPVLGVAIAAAAAAALAIATWLLR
jgi:transcriptional regulator with XRE-family HTH domain